MASDLDHRLSVLQIQKFCISQTYEKVYLLLTLLHFCHLYNISAEQLAEPILLNKSHSERRKPSLTVALCQFKKWQKLRRNISPTNDHIIAVNLNNRSPTNTTFIQTEKLLQNLKLYRNGFSYNILTLGRMAQLDLTSYSMYATSPPPSTRPSWV